MAKRPLPTPEELRQLLRYEPETGKLYWRERPLSAFSVNAKGRAWNNRFAGKEAFTASLKGYKVGGFDGKGYRAHRVAWAIYFGKWPADQLDHINGDRSDNRIKNLRNVTNAENARNRCRQGHNNSGHTGVHWHKRDKKWSARVKVGGQDRYIGCFTDKADAIAARDDFNKKHGFTERHGK